MNSQRTLVAFLAALLISCGSGPKSPEPVQQTAQKKAIFPTGKVIEKVHCDADTTNSYALYLPARYDTAKSFPVIVFFDAEARGVLAVNRLVAVAEKLGYIVVGSLTAKNGMPPEASEAIGNGIIEDIRAKLAVDGRRIYTAGFSGGARVATLMALKRSDVAGVIGCSAGFPKWDQPLPATFFYTGIAGRADFNYSEMTNLEIQLANSPVQHQFIYRDGVHEMPFSDEFSKAVTLMQIVAMKNGLTERNNNVTTGFIKDIEKEISALKQRNLLVDADNLYALLINQLDGLTNISEYKTGKSQLEQSPAFIQSKKQKDNADMGERALEQNYSQAFSNQSLAWWKNSIAGLQLQAKSTANSYDALMKKRVLAYIALMSHMNYDAAMKQGAASKARDFVEIKILAEPKIPMGQYLKAVFLATQGSQSESKAALSKALELGFSDLQKFVSEQAFFSMKSSPDYKAIIAKIQSNFEAELKK